MDFIPTWAQAIAQFEGFNTPNTVAARNHNPGNLKYAGQPGATGQDSRGFAIFPDDGTGWQALYNQLAAYVQEFPGYSLLDMMAHYLGQSSPTTNDEGNAYQYASYVASRLGVATSATLAQLAGLVAAPIDIGTGDAGGDDGTGGMSGGSLAVIVVTLGLLFLAASRAWG